MWPQMTVVSNECDLKWMPSQMNAVSNECRLKWMPSQMNAVSNECGLKRFLKWIDLKWIDLKWIDLKWIDLKWIGLKWIGLNSHGTIILGSRNKLAWQTRYKCFCKLMGCLHVSLTARLSVKGLPGKNFLTLWEPG